MKSEEVRVKSEEVRMKSEEVRMKSEEVREFEVHDSYRLVEGRFGDRVPIYWNRTCERIAIEAFLSGEWGLLTVDEIEFFRAAQEK